MPKLPRYSVSVQRSAVEQVLHHQGNYLASQEQFLEADKAFCLRSSTMFSVI